MKNKLDLRKMRQLGYSFYVLGFIDFDKSVASFCILCHTVDRINVQGVWVDDTRKRVTFYNLCKECAEEFFAMSEKDRANVIAEVIEKKLMVLWAFPHWKMSELIGDKYDECR